MDRDEIKELLEETAKKAMNSDEFLEHIDKKCEVASAFILEQNENYFNKIHSWCNKEEFSTGEFFTVILSALADLTAMVLSHGTDEVAILDEAGRMKHEIVDQAYQLHTLRQQARE